MTAARRLVEIRSYQLHPGQGAALHEAVRTRAVPMLRAWGTEVVAFGPSPHAPDTYCLIRAYDSLADREARQAAFYGSDEWRQGPREAIVGAIASYLDTVLWLDDAGVAALKTSLGD